ncbi:MAG: glycosyltransferase family 39 protein [Pirellulaceae bacterium]
MCRYRYPIAVAAILLLAIVARCATAVWWQERLEQQGKHFAFGDSESYWRLAIAIAEDQPYAYGGENGRIFRVPLYPLMIAPFIDSNDPYRHVLSVRLLGSLLGTLAVGGIIVLGRDIFGKPASLCAGLLAALYPGGVSMSILVLSEAPFCPLMVVNLLLWRNAMRSERLRKTSVLSVLAGGVAGLAVLARPSWLLFAPFAGFLQWIVLRDRRTVVMGASMLVGFVVVMTPWWLRNYQITGHFVLTTLQVGGSMYDGLHPGATGASDTGMGFTSEFALAQQEADAAVVASTGVLDSTFEYRLNARMAKAAKEWVFANPIEFVRLAFIKIGRTWRPWPVAEETSGRLVTLAAPIGFFAVMLPALIGLWRQRARGWEIFLLWAPAIYFTLLHAVFIGSMRYRLPAVLVLSILAGATWCDWLKRWIDWTSFVGGVDSDEATSDSCGMDGAAS